MATTINHTGRRKLKRDEFSIRLEQDASGIPSFDMQLSIKDKRIHAESSILVEVHNGNVRQRFDFGTYSRTTKPANTLLDKLPATGSPKFTVLIIDRQHRHGLILARAYDARASGDEEDTGSSLLVIRTWPMDEMLWNVSMNTGQRPELCLNSRLPDAINLLKTDPVYQALILPAALRQVLSQYASQDCRDDDNDDVQAQWWELAEHCAAHPRPDDEEEFEKWMDDVVSGFSKTHEFCSQVLHHMETRQQ